MAAIISDTKGDGGRFPDRRSDSLGSDQLVKAFASSSDNPVVTPSMLRKAGMLGAQVPDASQDPLKKAGISLIGGAEKSASLGSNESGLELERAAKISLDPVTQEVKRKENPADNDKNPQDIAYTLPRPLAQKDKFSSKNYKISDVSSIMSKAEGIAGIDPSLMTNCDAHPLALLAACFKWFGESFFEWEPETLWAMLADIGAGEVPRCNKDKIMAIRAAHRIDNFYYSFHDFEILTNALNHKIVDFHNFTPPAIPEIANAVRILNEVRTDGAYNEEIKEYIRVLAKNDGWAVLPECLDFVDKYNDEMLYSDSMERAKEMLADPGKFNPESVIDGQAARLAINIRYNDEQDKAFSDDINQYFHFSQEQRQEAHQAQTV